MKRNFDDPSVARRIAQLLVTHHFDTKKVARLWAPEIKSYSALGARMMSEPMVQMELTKIMNREDNRASKFLDLMHDWLTASKDGLKETEENRRTAARILAKGYISEKKGPDTAAGKALVIDASASELSNLVDAPTKPGKPM